MRKYKKSFWFPFILFLYTTAMAVYFLPRNTEISNAEKWTTIGMSYAIIVLLWWVLRKKEKLLDKRNKEIEKTYKDNNN